MCWFENQIVFLPRSNFSLSQEWPNQLWPYNNLSSTYTPFVWVYTRARTHPGIVDTFLILLGSPLVFAVCFLMYVASTDSLTHQNFYEVQPLSELSVIAIRLYNPLLNDLCKIHVVWLIIIQSIYILDCAKKRPIRLIGLELFPGSRTGNFSFLFYIKCGETFPQLFCALNPLLYQVIILVQVPGLSDCLLIAT